ncbi:MAG: hypothetical protein EPN84_06350 [Legionella sp.]|nr:MAG: hypothetical protein EPN84_06350 [Legionella sp.]
MFKNSLLTLAALSTCLISSSLTATPVRLNSYTELVQALKNGHRVNSIMDFKKCELAGGDNNTDVEFDAMGMSFNQGFFLINKLKGESQFAVGAIATNTIPRLTEGAVNRYKLIRVFEDNTVIQRAIMSDTQTGKILGWSEYACKLSNGNDQNGVSLFDYDVN